MTVGTGNTVTIKVRGVPLHPFSTGVTVIVLVRVTEPVAAVALMSPEPLEGMPVAGLLFVQL